VSDPADAPNVRAALERAGLWPPTAQTRERVERACRGLDDGADEILEISHADVRNESAGLGDLLLVLTRTRLIGLGEIRRGILRKTETAAIVVTLDHFYDLIEDDELEPRSIILVAKEGHRDILLTFRTLHERHRMFGCVFEAHRGDFSRWGTQLDPDAYEADFDRYYEEISREGPSTTDGWFEWADQRYGDDAQTSGSALGCALAWRRAELDDQSPLRPGSFSARLLFAVGNWFRVRDAPAARRVLIRLCEQMYDAGLMDPPYDERTYLDDPISSHDIGPKRLNALMLLAAHAKIAHDPRASEWLAAASRAIPTVPPTVFDYEVREAWAAVEPGRIPPG
jgi:hypothetical protein